MKTSPPGRIRIVAGQWRGRKLPVPDFPGLRPTPERLRETLFNWLAPLIQGARCLDLFAGSGALGLEAASRGAGEVLLVERQAQLARGLQAHVALLRAAQVRVLQAEALGFLRGPASRFDMVFLDPPFAQDLLAPACHLLEERGWLADEARIYVEMERELERAGGPSLPENWEILRRAQAGQVSAWLALRRAACATPAP